MKSLALVYASSLFSLCEDENKCEDVLKDLCAIYAILEENDILSTCGNWKISFLLNHF